MRLTVDLSETLAGPLLAAAGADLSAWVTDAVRAQLARSIARGEVELSGLAVRAVLSDADRQRFEGEFRAAVECALRDRNVEQVAEVVCGWWLTVGGDPGVVADHRSRRQRLANLTARDWPSPRPLHVSPHLVNQTGPDVRAALGDDQRNQFDDELEAALSSAARTFDCREPYEVVARYWAVAVTGANQAQLEQDRKAVERVKVGIEPLTYHAA